MGSLQSKSKAQAKVSQQPPALPNGSLPQTQVNHSGSISAAMDTAQREGSAQPNRSVEGSSTIPGVKRPPSPISPVDSHGTGTAVVSEPPYHTGCARNRDSLGKYQLSFPEGRELSSKSQVPIAFNEIYYPGATVFKKDLDAWRAYKVKRFEFHPPSNPDSILVHSYFLDFDKTGKWLVPQPAVLVVPSFLSKRSIEDLNVIPEFYFDDHNDLRKKLIERGRQYASYAGRASYREYSGDSWPTTSHKDPIKVIVDYTTASRHEDDMTPALHCDEGGMCSVCSGEKVQLQSYPKGAPHDPDICRRNSEPTLRAEEHSSADDPLLFCPPKLWAFSLSHKCWRMVLPEHLALVEADDKAMDELWMLRSHKDCLVSVLSHLDTTKGHGRDTDTGRVRGLNILLTGNTGTGKTFSVETLARKFGVPLYKIACGDLGSNPDTLEANFKEAMLRAANWSAILLLDEADVFIKRGGQSDFSQCVLLSILLGRLEHSDCIFFMTTHNVMGMPDHAIQSRLHLSLRLPDLTLEGQKTIWSACIWDLNNLNLNEKQTLDSFIKNDLEVMDSGEYRNLNGRQIRNCVTAALAVALSSGTTLKPLHIETMLRLGKEFRESVFQKTRSSIAEKREQLNMNK